MTGVNKFYEDKNKLKEWQEKHPLKKPAYWSMFNGAPAIKLPKKVAGTVADGYVYSAGGPFPVSNERRVIVCHPPKGKSHRVTECPFDELANVMYHMYLVGAWCA